MLSYDSLLALSKERGLPPGKLRGAVREYVQVAALKSLYARREARTLVFLGGTALRLGWDLPRFSEDLDFDARELSLSEWSSLLEHAAHGLSLQGFEVRGKAAEKGSLLAGELRFSGVLQAFRVTRDPGEKLRVKVEANRPSYPLTAEARLVSTYGEMVLVPFASPGLIAAEKVLCLLSRELGRDVFDLLFVAGKRWKPDPRILRAKKVRDPVQAVLERVSSFGPKGLASMARRLEPFLFDPAQARLVAEADRLLPAALEPWAGAR